MTRLLQIFLLFFTAFSLAAGQGDPRLTTEQQAIRKELLTINNNKIIGASTKDREVELSGLLARSRKADYEFGILGAGAYLMNIYLGQNRNKDVVELGNELIKYDASEPESYSKLSGIYRMKALALSYMGLYEACLKDYKEAVRYARLVPDSDIRHYLLAMIYLNMTSYYHYKQFDDKKMKDSIPIYHTKSLQESSLIRDNNPDVSNELKYDNIAFNHIRMGIHYLEQANVPGSLDKAEDHLMKSLAIYEDRKLKNVIPANKIMALNQISWLYLEKKEFRKSVDYALRALELEKQHSDAYHRVESFEFLGTSYLELGDKAKSKYYMNRYTALKDSISIAEKLGADQVMDKMVTNVKQNYDASTRNQWLIAGGIFLTAICAAVFLWLRRERQLRRNYNTVIDRLKAESIARMNMPDPSVENNGEDEDNDMTVTDEDKDAAMPAMDEARNVIAGETETRILKKLQNFEKSGRFLRKDITNGYLAGQLGTNSRYLSEIIKMHRGQSFSGYINLLKINYIVDKLYSEPKYREYKISYLAEECGYSSPQVFVLAFKKINGVTPSYFIKSLKEDQAAAR